MIKRLSILVILCGLLVSCTHHAAMKTDSMHQDSMMQNNDMTQNKDMMSDKDMKKKE
ncbi:hypothetical protein [Geopsychrobacter electrodiphilus]|uniref:hypothetical protein n=1 Tax=Geopsychrobacter electrodiphilus TaxID=225196 RepID=UPI0003795515|nr:hypothetical protein [Geopsychrobacter electrodiphilus]